MNKFVIAALAAATLLPSAAMARPADHDRSDTRVVVVDHRVAPARVAWHKPVAPTRIVVGTRVEPGFVARHETIKSPARYRLARAGSNGRWVRVHDDAVLINLRTGRVLNIAYNLFR